MLHHLNRSDALLAMGWNHEIMLTDLLHRHELAPSARCQWRWLGETSAILNAEIEMAGCVVDGTHCRQHRCRWMMDHSHSPTNHHEVQTCIRLASAGTCRLQSGDAIYALLSKILIQIIWGESS